MSLNGKKTVLMPFKGHFGRKSTVGLNIDDSEKNGLQGLTCPHPGPIYMYILSKHYLLWNHLANQSQILCEASGGKGEPMCI